MRSAPNTMGQLRKMLAETLHDVRYGHLDAQKGLAVAKIAAQINNTMNVEIEAARFMLEVGNEFKTIGDVPINNPPQLGGAK